MTCQLYVAVYVCSIRIALIKLYSTELSGSSVSAHAAAWQGSHAAA